MKSQYVKSQASELGSQLCQMFPTQSPSDFVSMLTELFSPNADEALYRTVLKNFLISIRQISPTDPDLNELEKKQMIEQLNQEFGECPGFIDQTSTDKEEGDNDINEFEDKISGMKI